VIDSVVISIYERGVSSDHRRLSSTCSHGQQARRRHKAWAQAKQRICFKLISLNSPSPLMRPLHVAPLIQTISVLFR
jgi:hypothetical protein